MYEVRYYLTSAGVNVVDSWLASLRDDVAEARIEARIVRLAGGNFGDCKPLRDGVWELRIDWGPGYRVYYAKTDRVCVLLLCGGDKRSQVRDIARAVQYWRDYQKRSRRP